MVVEGANRAMASLRFRDTSGSFQVELEGDRVEGGAVKEFWGPSSSHFLRLHHMKGDVFTGPCTRSD
jgi:hypothetical protein